jgi:glycosyltransferase involved in cell wall biosynthesis
VQTDTEVDLSWLKSFADENGRALRVLHIGNIANNAYINAKIQRRIGIEADVCCYDYFHVMGCPEWEDSEFEGDIRDQFFPDWWAVDLKGFQRPAWFAQGRQRTCQRYLLALRQGDQRLTRLLGRQLRFELWLRCRSTRRARIVAAFVGVVRGGIPQRPRLPRREVSSAGAEGVLEWLALALLWAARAALFVLAWLRWRLRVTVLRRLSYGARWSGTLAQTAGRKSVAIGRASIVLGKHRDWRTAALMIAPRKLRRFAQTDEHDATVAAAVAAAGGPSSTSAGRDSALTTLYDAYFPNGSRGLAYDDYSHLLAGMPAWRDLLAEYDIVQAYATDPLIPLMCGFDHFAAYEHGTLRTLPFEESSRGRLCALSYRAAPAVFVTNSDVLPAARRLGLSEEQMVFLPHAVDSDRLEHFAAANEHLRPDLDDPVVFLSPTRHDWADRDPLGAKGNDRLIQALAIVRDEGLACRLHLFEWGRHVDASKKLIADLALEDHVVWLATMRKQSLWSAYMSSHAIVDQFLTPAMGSVTFEALALGCRVLTAIDPATAGEFFGTPPPVLNCASPIEIAAAMARVIADPLDDSRAGIEARTWFSHHHSTKRILELEVSAYRRVLYTSKETPDAHDR